MPRVRERDAESTGATNRRFTSYDRSSSTGLDYAVNRTYDSAQGRFTQVDPIEMEAVDLGDPQSLNLYAYCGNDPVNHTDPEGLFFKKLFKGIWKILKSKWFLIAVMVALTIISIGANASWWALSITKGFNVTTGLFCTIGAAACLGGAWAVTQITTLGYIAGGLAIAAAIPGLTSVKSILSNAASYGAGLASGGIGGGAGGGGTPGWNPDNGFAQRGGGTRPPSRRNRTPRFPQSQYHWRKHPFGRRPMTRAQYYESAVRHTQNSHARYNATHRNPDGTTAQRVYHVSRLGNDSFLFTATTPNGRIIVTHYEMFGKDIRKLGIHVHSYPPNFVGPIRTIP